MTRVSVIIPSYNHGKFVCKAIRSVLEQTERDIEIIIRDDKSKDNTLTEIKKFQDPRIKLIASHKNIGQFASTNICIKKARGEFLCFLNSDDTFKKDKLEKQISYLKNNSDIAAVFTRPELVDDEGKVITDNAHFFYKLFNQPFILGKPLLRFFFFGGNFLCHSSIMIRRKVQMKIGLYNPLFAQLGDMDYWIRLSLQYQIGMIEEKLTQFRLHTNKENMSGDKPSTFMRSSVELKYILCHFLGIKDVKELVAIFPELKDKYKNPKKQFIPFYIAMLCFNSPYPYHHQFGLDTLYGFLQNPKTAQLVFKEYGFTNQDFIQLTGKYNISQNTKLSDQQQQLNNKLLEEIRKSKFYKVWRLYHKK